MYFNLLLLSNRRYAHYNEVHEKASANIGNYLKNPINAFQMIKRLTADWAEVERTTTLDNVMGTN
jgi:hypothetical protein